jgi:hypothetical protein
MIRHLILLLFDFYSFNFIMPVWTLLGFVKDFISYLTIITL